MDVLAQSVTSGVLLGLILALSAAGLTLIWGVMDIVNFAPGEIGRAWGRERVKSSGCAGTVKKKSRSKRNWS